uniref:Uncharacterized protein n=1 Tax=Gouania willdenowi TaxID=441366 RepID=A0A8C5DF79_GOUWI
MHKVSLGKARMCSDLNGNQELSWMAYDMVTLRTDPQLVASLQKLEETFQRCRAAVAGNSHLEKTCLLLFP